MKYLLEKGLLDGDCMTVTGKTLAENLADLPGLKAGQTSSTRSKNRSRPRATSASCAATSPRRRRGQDHRQGRPGLHRHRQGASTRRRHAPRARSAKKIVKGRRDHHPLRRPQGRPRHARDADAHLGHHGRRARQHVALMTDGRFSGGSHGFIVGHVTPEAQEGRPDRAGARTATRSRSTPRRTDRRRPLRRRTGRRARRWKAPPRSRPPAARSTSTSRT
jgi:dihydroxy-acid dehydratase